MSNLTGLMQDTLRVLLATKDPAEKAAIIADLTLNELPETVVFVARRCVIFHWFDQSILEVLLKEFDLTQDEIRNVYEQLEALPFIEKLPWGLTFQDLTREGLLKRHAARQSDLLKSAALQAASVYEAHNADKIVAEAVFCYFIAQEELNGEQLTDKLTKRANERGDQQFVDNLRSLANEARQIPFVGLGNDENLTRAFDKDETAKDIGTSSSVIPMIQQSQDAHSDSNQKQKPGLGSKGPRSANTIISSIVIVAIVVSIIATILFINDLSLKTTVVISLLGLMFAYMQWMHPRSPNGQVSPVSPANLLSPPSPTQTPPRIVVQPDTIGNVASPSEEAIPPQEPDPSIITQPLGADALFFFNVTNLPSLQEFFGRKMDRETLLNRTASRQATSLVGPRRIGKTWLIQYLILTAPRRFGSRYRISYLDATAPSCMTVAGFVATALRKLNVVPLVSSEPNLLTLEQAVEDLRRKGYSPVLCIDEFERLSNSSVFDSNFFSGLRAVAHAGLGLVVASKSPLIEIVDDAIGTSPFFNIFEQLTLEPFDRQEAETFIQIKGQQVGFTEREEAAMLRYGQIQEQWPPLRLQLVGKLLLESIRTQEYQPDNEQYWQKFQQRLEDKYQGAVR